MSTAQPNSVTDRLLNFGPAPCHEYDLVTRFAQCSLTDDEVELVLLIRTIQSLFVMNLTQVHDCSGDGRHGALAGPAGLPPGRGQDVHALPHGPGPHRLRSALGPGHRRHLRLPQRQERDRLHHRVPGLRGRHLHQHRGNRGQLQEGRRGRLVVKYRCMYLSVEYVL